MDTTATAGNLVNSVSGEDFFATVGIDRIPFATKLSFAPLIRHWKSKLESPDYSEAFLAGKIMEEVEKVPAFQKPITSEKVLEKHKPLVDLLIGTLFPASSRQNELGKVIPPFDMNPIYITPLFQELILQNKVHYVMKDYSDRIYGSMVINACSAVLNKFYGQLIKVELPMFYSIQNAWSKLPRFYKASLNTDFVEIKKLKPLKPLSQEQINNLISNIYDIDLWLEAIPPSHFEFHGIIQNTLQDITREESLSRLEYSLLTRDAVVTLENIKVLEKQLQTFFQSSDLMMGVTAIDFPLENAVPHKYKIRFDFLAAQEPVLLDSKNSNSIYEKACKYGEVLLVEDLEQLNNKTPIEEGLLALGIRSIMVAPLLNQEQQVIGLLEVGSPLPYELNSFMETKLKEIQGLFGIAMERSRDEIDNRIEAIVREQFTAVHSSVEWKFIEAAYNLMERREKDSERATIDPIVFSNVYPLYGQSDIVSSSSKRNRAILADLIDNLEQAKSTILLSIEQIRFPLLNQLLIKTEQTIRGLKKEFNSNDESKVVEFLDTEVHVTFRQLKGKYSGLSEIIDTYFEQLDDELGVIYNKRKDYEDSVTILNNTIADFLDLREKENQKVLPHYFEKYKTDGVEYDMYVGQSILNKDTFSFMHLKNFRLSQLIDMCIIARKVKDLHKTLPVPLSTAQLVFVYSTPLSIRFRMDEKQFDVDGAYNVRYEILKKRIDKAVIEGTNERLTQAGKVAIVFLQERDRLDYLEFFEYLKHEEFITDEIEELRLGKLQGVQGLRALRVTVKM